jgi:hypothetical protein
MPEYKLIQKKKKKTHGIDINPLDGVSLCGRKLEAAGLGSTKPARAMNNFWLGKFV